MRIVDPVFSWFVVLIMAIEKANTADADDDYNVLHRDGSFEFGYNNQDSYHYADGNRRNVVRGEFGIKNPKTGAIDSTVYTAGPRGFRPRGKNIARKYNLNQNGPRAIGSPDDPYYDPLEDPSYNFSFRTRTYNRDENANRLGDVKGRYSYLDDVGERHNVEYIAGKNTGFHVKTPFPDSNPRAYGPLYYRGRGKPIPRGRTSIQRGLDGSYKFVSSGPDQRRTETSDSTGHVRGSYTYLDDKGVQHSVHYIAGPETGYRVLKEVKGPHLPTVFPFGRPEIIPPDFYDGGADVFDTAASGHIRPSKGRPSLNDVDKDSGEGNDAIVGGGNKKPRPTYSDDDSDSSDFGDIFGGGSSTTTLRPTSRPNSSFGKKPRPSGSVSSYRPSTGGSSSSSGQGSSESSSSEEDDGSYKGSEDDGSYKPPRPSTKRPSIAGGSTLPPSGGNRRPPIILDSSEEGYGPSKPSSSGYGSLKPSPGFQEGYDSNAVNNDDFGLFGSETNNPRRPYGGPVITIDGVAGAESDVCPRCRGTIVTNVGDRPFSVPPGVSVRAHVQAIDLTAISPKVPSPSEQYKADVHFARERLLADEDDIVKDEMNLENTTTTTTEKSTITTSSSIKTSATNSTAT